LFYLQKVCSAGCFVLLTTNLRCTKTSETSLMTPCAPKDMLVFWTERAEHFKCFSDTLPVVHMYSTAVVFVMLGIYYFRVSFLIAQCSCVIPSGRCFGSIWLGHYRLSFTNHLQVKMLP